MSAGVVASAWPSARQEQKACSIAFGTSGLSLPIFLLQDLRVRSTNASRIGPLREPGDGVAACGAGGAAGVELAVGAAAATTARSDLLQATCTVNGRAIAPTSAGDRGAVEVSVL